MPRGISFRKNSAGLFGEGKSDDGKEENRRNTFVFQGSMTLSALICTVEKRVCPCQGEVCLYYITKSIDLQCGMMYNNSAQTAGVRFGAEMGFAQIPIT